MRHQCVLDGPHNAEAAGNFILNVHCFLQNTFCRNQLCCFQIYSWLTVIVRLLTICSKVNWKECWKTACSCLIWLGYWENVFKSIDLTMVRNQYFFSYTSFHIALQNSILQMFHYRQHIERLSHCQIPVRYKPQLLLPTNTPALVFWIQYCLQRFGAHWSSTAVMCPFHSTRHCPTNSNMPPIIFHQQCEITAGPQTLQLAWTAH